MNDTDTTTPATINMGLLDRSIRISAGLAVLFGTLSFSIDGSDAYPLTKLFATIVVLTGITGWDPFYAVFRIIVTRMSRLEAMTFSKGNIGLVDRTLRIGLGLVVLFSSLHFSIGGVDVDPQVKMFAAVIVLTGIAGWDPLYATVRSIASRIGFSKPNYSLAHIPLH